MFYKQHMFLEIPQTPTNDTNPHINTDDYIS